MADDETDWAAQLLSTSIEASGLSERELEKRLGWKRGTLGKILQSGIALSHHQILDVLAVLSREAREEGASASGKNGGGPMVGTLLERFNRLGYTTAEPPARDELAEPSPQGAELERKVEEILADAFGHLDKGKDDEE